MRERHNIHKNGGGASDLFEASRAGEIGRQEKQGRGNGVKGWEAWFISSQSPEGVQSPNSEPEFQKPDILPLYS